MKNRIIALFSLLLASLLPVSAQTQFIVSTPANQITQITAQFGLTLVEALNSTGGVYLVSAPANVSVQQVLSELAGDTAIQTFEQDSSLESAEMEPGTLVKVDTSVIQSALSNTDTVSFYSSIVRAAYVS